MPFECKQNSWVAGMERGGVAGEGLESLSGLLSHGFKKSEKSPRG